MIKVLQLIPTLDQSGAEKQLTLLATGLPRDEFQVEVLCLTRGGPYAAVLQDDGIRVDVLGKRWRFDPLALRRLKQEIATRQPDILHSWLFAGNSYGRLAVGAKPPCRVVVSERCVDSWKARWQLWLDRKLAPRADRMVANSEPVAAFYRDLGIPSDNIVVIHNGIERPLPSEPDRVERLREFGIPGESRVVGFVGRLARQKRLLDLIWAFELLLNHDLDLHFLIVGDGPERSDLESFARQIRCNERVHFAGHRRDSLALLRCCDIFWLASDFEGQSNSLMEAMSLGLPVIVSDIEPNRELVQHEESGLVVPVRDRVEFTKAAIRLLNDDGLAKRLGDAARDRMRSRFSVERMVDATANLYRTLVSH